MASLTVIKGADRGRRFEVTESVVTLGRDARNLIRLHDSETSRNHAELRRSPQGYVVHDLDSSNGTFVNEDRVELRLLKTGDHVRIGQSELIYTADAPPQPAPVDLASKIAMIATRPTSEPSAIVHSMKPAEASRILAHPEKIESQWLKDALSNLSVLYETSRAATRINDVGELLDHIMDLVFSAIRADRGCVVLKDAESGKLRPTSVRYADGVDTEERIALSRTITDWVLKSSEGVIVIDASQDERFNAAQSIVQLKIREAICVPLLGRHETLGVLYVDTTSGGKDVLKTQRPTHFTEDHLKLMIAIAHQAGLAIEDSRFYQAMMQAERMAAVGQTIATVSHHIKNILQGLRSGAYIVDMGLKEKKIEVVEQGWGVVQKNQDKIYNLVMDMLSYSKDREPSVELCDPNTIARDVVELMAPRAKELGIALESTLDPNLGQVLIDPEGIHRVLLNIVSNAMDATEGTSGARVVVQTSTDPRRRYLNFSVTDNGMGIPAERMDKIFQVFSSTKGSKGTGLGLAVSQKIAREHGGVIRVASTVGKGSQFTIELPIRRHPSSPDPSRAVTLTEIDVQTKLKQPE